MRGIKVLQAIFFMSTGGEIDYLTSILLISPFCLSQSLESHQIAWWLYHGKHHGFSHGFSRVFKSLLGVYPPILSNVWSNNMLFLGCWKQPWHKKKHLAALATGLIRAWPQAGRGTLARCIFFGDARVLIRV